MKNAPPAGSHDSLWEGGTPQNLLRKTHFAYFFLSSKGILNTVQNPANLRKTLFPWIFLTFFDFSNGEYHERAIVASHALASAACQLRQGDAGPGGTGVYAFYPAVSDFRDLTRPVRRKSTYPTMQSFFNGLRRMTEAHDQLCSLLGQLQDHLDAIRDHAQREKLNRKR